MRYACWWTTTARGCPSSTGSGCSTVFTGSRMAGTVAPAGRGWGWAWSQRRFATTAARPGSGKLPTEAPASSCTGQLVALQGRPTRLRTATNRYQPGQAVGRGELRCGARMSGVPELPSAALATDPQRELTDQVPAERLVVAAAVLHRGRVLAQQRAYPPAAAGRWELPGGRVEPAESDVDAVRRECAEELGVRVDVGAPVGPDVVLGKEMLLRVYRAGLTE